MIVVYKPIIDSPVYYFEAIKKVDQNSLTYEVTNNAMVHYPFCSDYDVMDYSFFLLKDKSIKAIATLDILEIIPDNDYRLINQL